MRTVRDALVLLGFYLAFPLIAGGLLVGLATLIKPDRLDADLAGWVYLGIVLLAMAVAFVTVRHLARPRR